jgi:hypothetical protein
MKSFKFYLIPIAVVFALISAFSLYFPAPWGVKDAEATLISMTPFWFSLIWLALFWVSSLNICEKFKIELDLVKGKLIWISFISLIGVGFLWSVLNYNPSGKFLSIILSLVIISIYYRYVMFPWAHNKIFKSLVEEKRIRFREESELRSRPTFYFGIILIIELYYQKLYAKRFLVNKFPDGFEEAFIQLGEDGYLKHTEYVGDKNIYEIYLKEKGVDFMEELFDCEVLKFSHDEEPKEILEEWRNTVGLYKLDKLYIEELETAWQMMNNEY